MGRCVFTIIFVHSMSSWLLSVAIYPQSLPYSKFMSYPSYFNDCIVKVIGLAQTYVWPRCFYLFPPQVLRLGLVLVDFDQIAYFSLLDSLDRGSKVRLIIYLWLLVYVVGLCTFILSGWIFCTWLSLWFLICNQTCLPSAAMKWCFNFQVLFISVLL